MENIKNIRKIANKLTNQRNKIIKYLKWKNTIIDNING